MKQIKLVQGVGINDASYVTQEFEYVEVSGKRKRRLSWICPYYSRWLNMLHRAYSGKDMLDRPTYEGCSVCVEWLTFSNFKAWMEVQDWEGKQLDKDLLVRGNKIYSPDTCIFVEGRINNFMNDHAAKRGKYLLGVDFDKKQKMFRSRVNHPVDGPKHIGYFPSELEAHNAWKAAKHEIACDLADNCVDYRLAESLRGAYK